MTPLQTKVSRLISDFELRQGRRISGRELSSRIGKSRNHLSQILNDGLVPSGEVLMKLAGVLELDKEMRDELVLDAMRTKVVDRARDCFWLEHALDLNDRNVARAGHYDTFLANRGLYDEFVEWLAKIEAREAEEEKLADAKKTLEPRPKLRHQSGGREE
ncbi:MAG: helix-turn-helix transcriptional regulator [Planctomycetota bacterium]